MIQEYDFAPPTINPAVSEAQRRYLNATKGHEWVKEHSFDNRGELPEKKEGDNGPPSKKRKKITSNRARGRVRSRSARRRPLNGSVIKQVGPNRIDPSQTGALRRRMLSWVQGRFQSLVGDIIKFIELDDSLELRTTHNSSQIANTIEVPNIRQRHGWDCGAACAMSVGKHFGVGPDSLGEWAGLTGSMENEGTNPASIIGALRGLGLDVDARDGMTLADLKLLTESGIPVICPVQDYGSGHYLVVIGVTDGYVLCQDPSADNALAMGHGARQLSDVGSAQEPGRVVIALDDWDRIWHDKDSEDNEYIRFGIAVSNAKQALNYSDPHLNFNCSHHWDEQGGYWRDESSLQEVPVGNAFCPTGVGGGVDASCGKGTGGLARSTLARLSKLIDKLPGAAWTRSKVGAIKRGLVDRYGVKQAGAIVAAANVMAWAETPLIFAVTGVPWVPGLSLPNLVPGILLAEAHHQLRQHRRHGLRVNESYSDTWIIEPQDAESIYNLLYGDHTENCRNPLHPGRCAGPKKVKVPKVRTPSVKMPKVKAPSVKMPKTATPKVKMPKIPKSTSQPPAAATPPAAQPAPQQAASSVAPPTPKATSQAQSPKPVVPAPAPTSAPPSKSASPKPKGKSKDADESKVDEKPQSKMDDKKSGIKSDKKPEAKVETAKPEIKAESKSEKEMTPFEKVQARIKAEIQAKKEAKEKAEKERAEKEKAKKEEEDNSLSFDDEPEPEKPKAREVPKLDAEKQAAIDKARQTDITNVTGPVSVAKGGKQVAATLMDGIKGSKGLSKEDQAQHLQSVKNVLSRMSEGAMAHLNLQLKGTSFAGSQKEAMQETANTARKLWGKDGEETAKKYEDDVKAGYHDVGGTTLTGSAGSHVVTDGAGKYGADFEGRYGKGALSSEGILAHELGHAIDHAAARTGTRHSDTQAFKEAYGEEMAHDQLTSYSSGSRSEAFAEFHRLLNGTDIPHHVIEHDFPKTSKYMKDNGLWPRARPKKATTNEERQPWERKLLWPLFSHRLPIGNDGTSHSDCLHKELIDGSHDEDRKWAIKEGESDENVHNSLILMASDIQSEARTLLDEVNRTWQEARNVHNGDEPTVNAPDYFTAHSSPEKLEMFKTWLQHQLQSKIIGLTEQQLWEMYAREGYKKGAGRAFDQVRMSKLHAKHPEYFTPEHQGQVRDFYAGTKDEFLRDSFAQPVSVERIKLLASRSFDDLKNVTHDMSTRMSRTLMDGLTQGKSPHDVAADLVGDVGISRSRAETIARSEIIRAHAEGQLDAFTKMGVENIGVAVEWSTTGDEKVCPKCLPLEGIVLKVSEAHGMLPRHCNCRCAFIPANVDEDDPSSKNTRGEVLRAIQESREEDSDGSAWGPAKPISKDRPKSIFNSDNPYSGELVEDSYIERMRADPLHNSFCPTGEGGGRDPSCDGGNSSLVEPLTPGEKTAIARYTNEEAAPHHDATDGDDYFKKLQKASTSGTGDERTMEDVKNLQSAIGKSVVHVPHVVHRGIVLEDNPDSLVGKIMHYGGFQSTSTDKETAHGYMRGAQIDRQDEAEAGGKSIELHPVRLDIRLEKGDRALPVKTGLYSDASETILPHHTAFKVIKVKEDKDDHGSFKVLEVVVSAGTHNYGGDRWTIANAFCPTGIGGGVKADCSPHGATGTRAEQRKSRIKALAKIAVAPIPSKEAVKSARAELEAARSGEGRAGGESRGGGAADRRRQRANLFKEWGGEERGYVVCPWTGIKMHWSADAKDNPHGLPTFERGKIFVKCQGGGYQLANLIPESFTANRARNDARLRKENSRGC